MYLTNELETICFLAEIKSYPQYGIIDIYMKNMG